MSTISQDSSFFVQENLLSRNYMAYTGYDIILS